jgi:aminopeptidase N
MKRSWTLAACLLAAGVAVASADTYPRQPVDARHYVFLVELRDGSPEIAAEAAVTLRLLENDLAEVALDLASGAAGKGMTVTEVARGGKPLRFVHERDRLRVPLEKPIRAGQEITLSIKYHGVPASGLRIGPNKYGEPTFFAGNWPDKARQWLPTIDHISDKATAEFIVTAPSHYQVVANGRLVEEVDLPGELRRTHWRQSVPVSPWLYTVGVASFAVHHADPVAGVPLQSWVYPRDREVGFDGFETPARRAVSFFSELVGPYPYEKLANVEAAGISGGMEHASAIAYGEASVTGRPITNLVVHEIAHSWFGDSVTERDWDEVWLSEGFATYLTHLFVEHTEGRDAFVAGLIRDRGRVISAEAKMPDTPIVHRNLADMSRVLNTFVYQKGGWVLHMLRCRVGDEAFRSGLREYYRRYRDATASTEDFRRVMEEVSGQDLGPFFQQWLARPGVPSLRGTWSYNPVTKQVEIDLSQVQTADPFAFPLEVGISTATGQAVRVQKIDLSARQQRFEFPSDVEPAAVVLDPGTRLLFKATFAKRR